MIGGYLGSPIGGTTSETGFALVQISRFDNTHSFYTHLETTTIFPNLFENTHTFYEAVEKVFLYPEFFINSASFLARPTVNQTFDPTIDYPPEGLSKRSRFGFYFKDGFWRKSTGFFK